MEFVGKETQHRTHRQNKKKQCSQQVLKCHSIMPQAIASFPLDEWVEGKGGRRQCTFFTLETAEEDHKEGATEFLTTAASDEDWQQFF